MAQPADVLARFSMAFRFADFDEAGAAYETARDLIFGMNLNASAYRIVLKGITHVVVIGDDVSFPTLEQALPEICNKGELVEVPIEVVLMLALRRVQVSGPDVKFERNYGGRPTPN